MITEDYCDFETAKLLEEKGFDEKTSHVYYYYEEDDGWTFEQLLPHEKFDKDKMIHCPTQALVMKWLREIYNLNISVSVGTDASSDADGKIVEEWSFWTYLIESTYGNIIYDACAQFDPVEYQYYEEACESAIKHCLENLI